MWDVFISHASEDKEAIARPLADALVLSNLTVWYDEFALRLGDSLTASIDHGRNQGMASLFLARRSLPRGGRSASYPGWSFAK